MIRATLGLAMAMLLGLAGAVWVARDLDPLREVERFASARVRTVDLAGSDSFLRREPAHAVEEPAAPGAAVAAEAPKAAAAPPSEPVAETRAEPPDALVEVPELAAEVVDFLAAPLGSSAAFEEALEAEGDAELDPAAPAGPEPAVAAAPLDPDVSADLVRRMLAVYERAAERR